MIIHEGMRYNFFNALLKVASDDKRRHNMRFMRVEREEDGRLAYVCVDGWSLHILRVGYDFGFFEAENNYKFTVPGKAIAFKRLKKDPGFPEWRSVVPKETRLIAKMAFSVENWTLPRWVDTVKRPAHSQTRQARHSQAPNEAGSGCNTPQHT